MRGPYSHIQVVPKVESSVHNENIPQQVTFRRPSYSEGAASSVALPPKPTASLANMALGTTFAAKARAAELNAVRNHKAKAKEAEENEQDPSMATSSLGALKLTKPRSKSKTWKTLNLDDIPETASETDHPQSHHLSTIRTSTSTPNTTNLNYASVTVGAQSSPQVSHPASQQLQPSRGVPVQHGQYYFPEAQPVTAIPRFTNEMATQSAFMNPEQFRHQMHQINQLAMQQNSRYNSSDASAPATALYTPFQRSPESSVGQERVVDDDPFVDMPASLRQHPHLYGSPSDRHVGATTASAHGAQPAAQGNMSYELEFPTQQQQRANTHHPPGLPRPATHTQALHHTLKLAAERPAAPTADTHQRDPKPYTSFARSSEDGGKEEKVLQTLQQQAVNVSKTQVNLPSSTRTVLYDPVTQVSGASTHPHEPRIPQSSNEFVKTSEPLPWKNRPVDIYNMVPPTPVVPHSNVHERAAAAAVNQDKRDGNAYIRSLLSHPESAEQRLKSTEAWWNHDGRGQEQVRAYLERVADEHKKRKAGREYEDVKRALERQASFRDDRSDESNATTVPKAVVEGEAINRLMVPVIANLRSYAEDSGTSYFNKFSKAPAWAVDGGADGNRSFFGEDWGKPPSRVGRDPRYRPTFHEGRYTVFEPTDGRVSGRGW
ncbi:MAG: hypothetical protein LQ338_000657 [Usnochroma carphineum]|nr:MAG: hypothetical protein LQ338_000657 [Usnochroma carphineum]